MTMLKNPVQVSTANADAQLAKELFEALLAIGVREFCFCPGNRCSPFFPLLTADERVQTYYWYEERSAAFFALGRSRATGKPVAVITTSGTAAGELLPAAMEAYYSGAPLLLITADRPRRFRGTGAPQSAEQESLFGVYTPIAWDVAAGESIDLTTWSQKHAAHLNVCFEDVVVAAPTPHSLSVPPCIDLDHFFQQVRYPFIVVSTLPAEACEPIAQFLLKVGAPVFLEGISNLREDPRLQPLRIKRTDNLWRAAVDAHYPIDGVLRIGGVPTFRLWRDLEDKVRQLTVLSINESPFSGLSWGSLFCTPLASFFSRYQPVKNFSGIAKKWLDADHEFRKHLLQLFEEEPKAEASLLYRLSQQIPAGANVYLGNSLPIREWDLAAVDAPKQFAVSANRGVNGIDGQISTFLGFCRPHMHNWGLFGDLTTLYDLAAPWILPQLVDVHATIVVVNNSGGQLFRRFFDDPRFLNPHNLHFDPVAKMWGLEYLRWQQVPHAIAPARNRLIELIPDLAASDRFWKQIATL